MPPSRTVRVAAASLRLGRRDSHGRAPAMRVLLTGGTGFIGDPVARALRAAGHDVTIVSRQPGHVPAKAIAWDGVRAAMPETDAIVNLAGEPVGEGRWTPARKQAIVASRIDATRAIVETVEIPRTWSFASRRVAMT